MTSSSKGIALRYFWEGVLSFFDASTWLLPFYPSARTIGSSVEALPQREVEGKEWTSSCRNLEGICIGEEDRSYTFNFRDYDARYHLHLDSFWKLLFFPLCLLLSSTSRFPKLVVIYLRCFPLRVFLKSNSYLYQLGGLFHLGCVFLVIIVIKLWYDFKRCGLKLFDWMGWVGTKPWGKVHNKSGVDHIAWYSTSRNRKTPPGRCF